MQKVAVYSTLFAFLAAASLLGCNDQAASPVAKARVPVPVVTPSCPIMNVTIPIAEGAMGKGAAAYGANPLVVPQGALVSWVNQDSSPHTATDNAGVWDTGVINPGETSTAIQFMNVGTDPYYCVIHGVASMSGTLEVVPLPSGCPMPSPVPSATPSETPTPVPSPMPTPTATPSAAPSAAASLF